MKNATFDLLSRATRNALEAHIESKKTPQGLEAFVKEWGNLLGRAASDFDYVKRTGQWHAKVRAEKQELQVRKAFDQIAQIGYYNSDSHNALCAIRFLQICRDSLSLPFTPTPDLAGLTKILEHYETN